MLNKAVEVDGAIPLRGKRVVGMVVGSRGARQGTLDLYNGVISPRELLSDRGDVGLALCKGLRPAAQGLALPLKGFGFRLFCLLGLA